jgi:hypothetical protein
MFFEVLSALKISEFTLNGTRVAPAEKFTTILVLLLGTKMVDLL